MLRQALDAADQDQKRQQQQQDESRGSGTTARPTTTTETTPLGAGAAVAGQQGDDRDSSTAGGEAARRSSSQQQAQQQQQQRLLNYGAITSSSITTSGQPAPDTSSYGEETGGSEEEEEEDEDDDDDDDDDDEEEDDEYWQGEDSSLNGTTTTARRESLLCRIWGGIKSFVLLVANVENLYDSDYDSNQYNNNNHHHHHHLPEESSSSSLRQSPRLARRNSIIVFFWFVILATTYTCERSTFKLLVDRAGPFRLFAVEMVTATHATLLGTGMFVSWLITKSNNHRRRNLRAALFEGSSSDTGRLPLGIPIVDVGVMALLDIFNLLLVFLTGIHVPPTLTVILVQFTLPLTAFMTQFTHPDGRCSFCGCSENSGNNNNSNNRDRNSRAPADDSPPPPPPPPPPPLTLSGMARDEGGGVSSSPAVSYHGQGMAVLGWGGLSAEHIWGSLILSLAVVLALIPALIAILNPDFFSYADTIPLRTAYNSLLYAMACAPAAASQLYKEHVFIYYKQPVNMNTLNLLLSIFQFIFASILAPLVFCLQGIGATSDDGDTVDWMTLYPSRNLSRNFWDGLLCFFWALPDEDQLNKYPEDARCDFTLGLTILHAFSIIAVGVAVDKIVNAGATKVMYRGISAGIILAVICLHSYDLSLSEFNYGPIVDGLNLACLLLLILGSEVYHRVSLQESTFQTVYPTMGTEYDDDD
jgi:hypothetical protein